VEVENLDEFTAANALARLNYIMLDELSPEDTQIALDTANAGHQIEISGGVDLHRSKDVQAFNQDVRISSGLLTKSVQPIDLSLRIAG
jgi:nicotinate-nucleotide pyrophosphorylase